MTREEFKTLVKGMKAVYAQPTFIPDQDAFNVSAVYDGNGNLVSFNRSVSGKAVWANKKAKQGGNKTCYLEKHLN